MGLMGALRKKIFPTREEQETKWKEIEMKRQKTFAHRYTQEQFRLASAKRQELLAKIEAERRERLAHAERLKPKPAQSSVPAVFDYDRLAKAMDYNPFEPPKKRRR